MLHYFQKMISLIKYTNKQKWYYVGTHTHNFGNLHRTPDGHRRFNRCTIITIQTHFLRNLTMIILVPIFWYKLDNDKSERPLNVLHCNIFVKQIKQRREITEKIFILHLIHKLYLLFVCYFVQKKCTEFFYY